MREPGGADAITDAVTEQGLIMVLPAGPTAERAVGRGARVAREAFADLEYDDGTIIEPEPEAKDPRACADKALGVLRGSVTTRTGGRIEVDTDTICVHGDRPNASQVAEAITEAFAAEGVRLAPMEKVIEARGA